jgi:hypothetical protein
VHGNKLREITDSREQRPPSESDSSSAGQEIPRLLRKPKFHYRIHKMSPLNPVLMQLNPEHNLAQYFFKIDFSNIPHLRLGLPSGLFRFQVFQLKLLSICHLPHACYVSYPAHPP